MPELYTAEDAKKEGQNEILRLTVLEKFDDEIFDEEINNRCMSFKRVKKKKRVKNTF